ncbi:MAG TPA: hypothetical protein VFV66_06105 [Nonomuraea sp.]|nr:hypothetical protein [Nonomuraea sp.]
MIFTRARMEAGLSQGALLAVDDPAAVLPDWAGQQIGHDAGLTVSFRVTCFWQ